MNAVLYDLDLQNYCSQSQVTYGHMVLKQIAWIKQAI